jgi:hypothetical protein
MQHYFLTAAQILRRTRMNRNTVALGFILALTSVAVVAQMSPPTPSPELKKLDYFTGSWTSEATIASGPWGAGGKFADTVSAEWMKGGFFVVSHSDYSMPAEMGGPGTSMSVLGYDPDKKIYTEERFDSAGRHVIMTGSLNGDTWMWTGENQYGGMTIHSRITIKMISSTSYSSNYEISIDGGASWMPFWNGKATKR